MWRIIIISADQKITNDNGHQKDTDIQSKLTKKEKHVWCHAPQIQQEEQACEDVPFQRTSSKLETI